MKKISTIFIKYRQSTIKFDFCHVNVINMKQKLSYFIKKYY